jgi:ankyrin repeat protein
LKYFSKESNGGSEDEKRDALIIAYQHTMDRINGQQVGRRRLASNALYWITSAKRPLSTLELQHALAVVPGDSELDEDNIRDIDLIVSVCGGLVTIDENSNVIRLVHYTTQEFFDKQEDWLKNADTHVAKICTTYLSFSVFESGICENNRTFKERLRLNPLYSYAARNWGYHANKVQTCQQEVESFLESDALVEASSQALLVKKNFLGDDSADFLRSMTGSHLAAYFGVETAVQQFLKNNTSPSKDSYGRTPLFYAAMNGHDTIVKALLEQRVNRGLNVRTCYTGTLTTVWDGGECDMKLQLEPSSISANLKDKDGRSPLAWAAINDHKAVVKLLLEADKMDADSRDNMGRSPLAWAALEGHATVVKLLLAAKEMDPDSKDKYGRTPLSWAAERGHETSVKQLLERSEVDADSKDENGYTPLSWAAENGHEAVVDLLLETGKVDIDSKSTGRFSAGQTPLSLAAARGHQAIVHKLSMTGKTDIDSKTTGNYLPGRTPLSQAACNGHEAVVKLLLEIGNATVDSKSTGKYLPYDAPILWVEDSCGTVGESKNTGDNFRGRTPLSWAAEGGYDAIIKLLLEKGADANSKDEDGLTPLFWASRKGHQATVETLLATPGVEADPTATGGYDVGRTPLSWAAEEGHEQVVELLLRNGAKADSFTTGIFDAGRTPLSWAAARGHEKVVELLLLNGAKADSFATGKDDAGWTPLMYAAAYGREAVVKLLLKAPGVEVNSKDRNARTALSHAAERGLEAVVKLLLQAPGLDADSKDKYGMTPLLWAAKCGCHSVVKLLQV